MIFFHCDIILSIVGEQKPRPTKPLPRGGLNPKGRPFFVKVNRIVADISTRGWMQHGNKKDV